MTENYSDSALALLMCSERCGSNLLRLLLDANPAVFAPNTMGMSGLLVERESVRASKSRQGWYRVLSEARRRINASTYYTGVQVSDEELSESVSRGDLVALYVYPYFKGMRALGSNRIVIKEHRAWRVLPLLIDRFPDLKVIAQVRDPRDYAVSCQKLARLYSSYHGSLPRALRVWVQDQTEILAQAHRHGNDRVHLHRYEDLVSEPVSTLKSVCRHIDLEWDPVMLNFHVKEAALVRQSSSSYLRNMWAKLDRPVTDESVGQWRTRLDSRACALAERQAGSLLALLGYERACVMPGVCLDVTLVAYRLAAAGRYSFATILIWLSWLLRTGGIRVPMDVILGNAVRAHRPFEYFRDRLGYRL